MAWALFSGEHMDKLPEGLYAGLLVLGAAALIWVGHRHHLGSKPGWHSITLGFGLLAVGSTLDFVDEFVDTLWILGGVDTEVWIEDLVLPLMGVSLLAYGVLRWAPMHAQVDLLKARVQTSEIEHLRAVNDFKTTFINAAAHELATPMTPIRLQLAMLERSRPDDAGVALLHRNIVRLERLVGDLLDAARLQSGRLAFAPQRVDLSDLLDEIAMAFRDQFATNGVTFEFDVPRGLVLEAADSVRLSQIFYNLLGNAAKFTPEGGRVHVAGRREGAEVVVDIEDTGLGLAPDELDSMFRPFQQHHREQVGSHVGTGLGLYVAQGIAERHGGRIEAHSAGRGKGSCFTVRLPIEASVEAHAPEKPLLTP